MSRKGNCLDNCIMESFFGTMKNEMYYGHESEYGSFESFSKAVDEFIAWYNNERIRYNRYTKKWMPPQACFEASLGRHPLRVSL
ncbi:MAG: IS3 family transposase [Bacilli bacterium]|nr:IS3 family transposase [Bacilli bacterium]